MANGITMLEAGFGNQPRQQRAITYFTDHGFAHISGPGGVMRMTMPLEQAYALGRVWNIAVEVKDT